MITDQKSNNSIVGVYLIDGTLDGAQLGITETPKPRHKFFAHVLLGWKWVSLKKLKNKNGD